MSTTEPSAPFTRTLHKARRCGRIGPAIVLLAFVLAGCERKPSEAAAAAVTPPGVTVAQPVKRTVTDWDEFTGRFEAVEEVQVRARVPRSSRSIPSTSISTWTRRRT